MKFTKFGKALLMSALSVGVVLSVTSCVQSYTVGYLYVTGTVTAQSSGEGIISGFKIDHNTGFLTPINGLPVSSGGANPGRAVLQVAGRFLYVLNRGVTASGGSNCTTADPCLNSNITQFAVGANGILTPQETFFTQGINPFRIIGDSTGNFLYVLEHDSPVTLANGTIVPSSATNPNKNCGLSLGTGVTTCGDITSFEINQTTGRLQLVVNAQVTSANGTALSYFPVPANPIDFVSSSGYVFTVSGTPTTGDSVFPYTQANGQLNVSQNSSQPLNANQVTAIVSGGTFIYVLDNEPGTTSSSSQILPFTVTANGNGSLSAAIGGAIPDDPTESNPIMLLVESKNKWAYVANQGNLTNPNNAASGIAGYVIDPNTHQLTFLPDEPFGTGAGPQCLVEDPSNQFIYTANFDDSSVTGRSIDENTGDLRNLSGSANRAYSLTGPATWCLVTGRTN